MTIVYCWKQDCNGEAEDNHDGELIGELIVCRSCEERQCNTLECACECSLEDWKMYDGDANHITINVETKNIIRYVE